MCTTILQFVFTLGIVAGAGLTVASLVTPAWHVYNQNGRDDYVGFIFSCSNRNATKNSCFTDWQNSPDWKKAAMACLILAVASCAAAFVWSCVACFACCCKSCLTPPLPILAGLACVLDIIGITIYAVKSGEEVGDAPTDYDHLQSKSTFGYSFWVGIGAIGALFLDTLVGLILVKTSKVSPM